jgi:competence CoiA-like predicted nuclease
MNLLYMMNLLHFQTKNKSLIHGLNREDEIFKNLYQIIAGDIERAKYKFSFFDFYCKSKHILFELKCLTYSISLYPNAIMNTSKIDIYKHMVFIFEYTDFNKEKQLYYHIYEHTRNYNRRYITPNNRVNTCEVIDIPIHQLTLFEPDTVYDFHFENNQSILDIELFDELLKKDEFRI